MDCWWGRRGNNHVNFIFDVNNCDDCCTCDHNDGYYYNYDNNSGSANDHHHFLDDYDFGLASYHDLSCDGKSHQPVRLNHRRLEWPQRSR